MQSPTWTSRDTETSLLGVLLAAAESGALRLADLGFYHVQWLTGALLLLCRKRTADSIHVVVCSLKPCSVPLSWIDTSYFALISIHLDDKILQWKENRGLNFLLPESQSIETHLYSLAVENAVSCVSGLKHVFSSECQCNRFLGILDVPPSLQR